MLGCEHDRQALLREMRIEAAKKLEELRSRQEAGRNQTKEEVDEENRYFLAFKRYAQG